MFLLRWVTGLRFPERTILVVLLLIAGSIWGFVEIADEVIEGGSLRFDETVLRMLRRADDLAVPIGPAWLHDAARDVTALGAPVVIVMVTAAVLGFLWLQGKKHAMWLVVVAVAGGMIATWLLKEVFGRERPALVPHLDHVTSPSFPSGHSILAAVTYLTLGTLLARTTRDRGTKVYLLTIAVLLSVLIGLSRIYLGVHFPTDVLAGWCAGIAWALACAIVARWLQQRGKVEPATAAAEVR